MRISLWLASPRLKCPIIPVNLVKAVKNNHPRLQRTDEDFLPYDENIEPIATEKEAAEYQEQGAQEEEEDEMLWSRFSGEEDVENWLVELFIIFVSLVDRESFFGPVN